MNTQEYIRLINNQKENLIKIDMKEKINLVELLKDCSSRMELDCAMNENVYFNEILDDEDSIYPIKCYIIENGVRNSIYFTKYGEFCNTGTAKCVIFPKGKTTWEGFQIPFKDGDVVATKKGMYIGIVKIENGMQQYAYVAINEVNNLSRNISYCFDRLATEEEKEKIFQAIKDNGYKWNQETKTLEKLVEPKFKVEDKVKRKNINYVPIVTIVKFDDDCYGYFNEGGQYGVIPISKQDDWELVPNKFDINTLVPFESRVLVRNVGAWEPAFWGYYSKEYSYPFVVAGGNTFAQCIPYEGNEHLLGTAEDFYKTWK